MLEPDYTPTPFIVYAPSTGEIFRYGMAPLCMINDQAGEGEAVLISNAKDNTHYISNGIEAARPTIDCLSEYEIAEDTGEISIIVPEGTIINYGTGPLAITDGLFEFSSSTAGKYSISMDPPFPYQTAIITVKVT